MRTIWRHNLACALIAQQLASAGTMDRDIAYTCGILHGIGLLALAVIRPREYIDLLGTFIGTRMSMLAKERAIFGIDHSELGKKLVEEWKLPEEFSIAMSGPYAPRPTDGRWGLPEIIGVSCRMADTAGFAPFSACHAAPFPDLLDELPPRERSLFHSDIESLSFEIGKKIAALEAI